MQAKLSRSAILAVLLTWSTSSQAATFDKVVGINSPGGGTIFVKRFDVPRGSVIVGAEIVSNDLRTTFPKVALFRGSGQRLSEMTPIAEFTDVRAVLRHLISLTCTPVPIQTSQIFYLAVTWPPSSGIGGVGDGAGIGALVREGPANSYLASARDEPFQLLEGIDLGMNLRFQILGKAESEGGSGRPAETFSRTFLSKGKPNPATGGLTIEFGLEKAISVTLAVYDISGRQVRNLVHESLPAGMHARNWDGRDERGQPVATGMYIARLRADGRTLTQKLVLTK